VNSANGKQESDFAKGKRMTPVEAVFNMYDGQATDYPFDRYNAEIDIYISRGKPSKRKRRNPRRMRTTLHQRKKNDEADSDEIPLGVEFFGKIAGFDIQAAKTKESDIDDVGIDLQIQRAGTVKFFSIFVAVLMWALAISVLFFVMSIVFRGRKVEVGMFSFLSALLFAFYAVRNSQPNIPPIGVSSDFIAFFWAK